MCDGCDASDECCKCLCAWLFCCNTVMNDQNGNRNEYQKQKRKQDKELESLIGGDPDPYRFEMSRVKF